MKRSFIHAADLHLGRPFSDLPEIFGITDICNNACLEAFKNIIDIAIKKSVDFVLFAGDNFDSEEQDLSTKLLFIKGLKKLADNNIKSYIICGNHDPVDLYKQIYGYFKFEDKYKDFIHITGVTCEELQKSYEEEDYIVHSISFKNSEAADLTSLLPEKINRKFNIGLIHCDLDKTESKYAPCSRENLRILDYNYYALGHIHLPEKKETNIIYAGTHQGRTKKETGAHGCFYVEFENNEIISVDFLPTDCVRFNSVEIDCTGFDSAENIFDKIMEVAKERKENVNLNLFEITLKGISNSYEQISNCENILEEFYKTTDFNLPDIKIYKINNKIIPEINDFELLNNQGVIGILANCFTENTGINTDEIYDNIYKTHETIYKKTELDDEVKETLKSSLMVDKEEIINRVKNELKMICKELSSTEK